MKKLFSLLLIAALSCTDTKPEAVKARLLADDDFKQYLTALTIKFSTDPASPDAAYKVAEAEKTSFFYYQRLYKNYISKNLLTSQQLNEIIEEKMLVELKEKKPD